MNNVRTMLLIVFSFCIALSICAAINPKEEKVIICGTAKNIAHALPSMIKKIEQLGQSFNDYHVIIYENNSDDKTRKILTRWRQSNPKVTFFSRNLSAKELLQRSNDEGAKQKNPCRIALLAYARNRVLRQAMSEKFNDFNFIIMSDLDFIVGWDIDEILASFALPFEWDCMTSNGVAPGDDYWDRYAYRGPQQMLGPELIGDIFWKKLGDPQIRLPKNMPPFLVYSAFGGLAIYKKEALKGCSYSCCPTPNLTLLSEKIINTLLSQSDRDYILYKDILNIDQDKLPIIFRNNSNHQNPIVCEHVTLHASMIMHGHDKIYVNPAMVCYYDL